MGLYIVTQPENVLPGHESFSTDIRQRKLNYMYSVLNALT